MSLPRIALPLLAALALLAGARSAVALAEVRILTPAEAAELGITVSSRPGADGDLRVQVEFARAGKLERFRWANFDLDPGGRRLVSAALNPVESAPGKTRLDLYIAPQAVRDAAITLFFYPEPRYGIGYRLPLKAFLPEKPAR